MATEKITYQYDTKTQTLEKGLNNVKTQGDQATKSMTTLGAVELTALVASTAMLTSELSKVVASSANFSYEMDKLQGITNATDAEMTGLTDEILRLGSVTTMSNTEVAIGAQNLAQMGFSATETQAALEGVVNASIATGTSMDVTSQVIGSMINQFDLTAEASSHLADVLVVSANSSAASVAYMGEAMKYGGATANSLGMSVEETSAAIMVMADAGLSASQAGMTLRSIMLRLIDPTDEVQAVLDELNITTFDAEGNFVGLTDVMGQFNKATEASTQQQKAYYASTIAGTTATSGFMAMTEDGTIAMADYTKALEECDGAAQKTADTMSSNLKAQMESLLGSIESVTTAILMGLEPVLLLLLRTMILAVNIIGAVVGVFFSCVSAIVALVGVIPGLNKLIGITLTLVREVSGIVISLVAGYYAWNFACYVLAGGLKFQESAIMKVVRAMIAEFFMVLRLNAMLFVYAGIIILVALAIMHWEKVSTALIVILKFLLEVIQMLVPVIQKLADILVNTIIPAFINVGKIVGGILIKAFKAWGETIINIVVFAFNLLSDILTNIIIPVITTLANLILTYVIPVWIAYGKYLLDLFMPIIVALKDLFLALIPVILSLAVLVGTILKSAFDVLAIVVTDLIIPLFLALKDIFVALLPLIIMIAQAVYKGLVIAFNILSTILSGFIIPLFTTLIDIFITYLIPAIIEVATVLINILSKAFAILTFILQNFVIPVLTFLVNMFSTVLTIAINIFVDVINNILIPALNFITAILTNFVIPTLEFLVNVLQVVLTTAINIVTGIINNVLIPALNILDGIIKGVTKIVEALATALEKTLSTAIDIVMTPINALITLFEEMLDIIERVTSAILDGLIGAFNSIPLVPNIDTSSAAATPTSARGVGQNFAGISNYNTKAVTYNVSTTKTMSLKDSLREKRLFENHGGVLI